MIWSRSKLAFVSLLVSSFLVLPLALVACFLKCDSL